MFLSRGRTILQLGQLHLQTGFHRAGAGCENVQDQLAAVQHLDLQRRFQIPRLGGRKIVVEDYHIGIQGAAKFGQLQNTLP
jgi:hypothetical protein